MSEDLWGKYLRAKEPGVREKAYEETVNRQAERIDDMDSPTERQIRQLRVSDVPDVMP